MQTDKNRKADREMEKNKHKKAIQADSISVDQTYYTAEGYLVDHPIVRTRTEVSAGNYGCQRTYLTKNP